MNYHIYYVILKEKGRECEMTQQLSKMQEYLSEEHIYTKNQA